MLQEIEHYLAWYKQLRKQYGVLTSLECFLYNGKHYNLDGSYRTRD